MNNTPSHQPYINSHLHTVLGDDLDSVSFVVCCDCGWQSVKIATAHMANTALAMHASDNDRKLAAELFGK